MTGTPAWLQDHIRANTRTARLHTCPTCRAPILTGHDNDTLAFQVRADPTPLDPPTELLALLAGRRTYNLLTGNGHLHLTHRIHWMIRHHPTGTVVVADHLCGQPLPADPTIRATHRPPAPQEPPF